jgi:hypothetical protein
MIINLIRLIKGAIFSFLESISNFSLYYILNIKLFMLVVIMLYMFQ